MWMHGSAHQNVLWFLSQFISNCSDLALLITHYYLLWMLLEWLHIMLNGEIHKSVLRFVLHQPCSLWSQIVNCFYNVNHRFQTYKRWRGYISCIQILTTILLIIIIICEQKQRTHQMFVFVVEVHLWQSVYPSFLHHNWN